MTLNLRYAGYAAVFLTVALLVTKTVSLSAEEGVFAVTFIPVYGKMQELVAVELIRPDGRDQRYQAIEKAVLESGWRRERDGDSYEIPGKCTVEFLPNEKYAVDCWLIQESGREVVLLGEVNTCEEAIKMIRVFSHHRKSRQLPKNQKTKSVVAA